ncbi:MAG: alpha/beta fold hydrolase [Pirellulaceae bacterium]
MTRIRTLSALACLAVVALLADTSLAQRGVVKPKDLPAPEQVGIKTKDGVTLRATYYASTLGKKAIPVILLHGWQRTREDVKQVALVLQREGMAVVAPDLRGHGLSKNIQIGNRFEELDLTRFRNLDFERFVDQDLESIKRFLMRKNNEGELNIELLTIIACDFSAVAALNFAAKDWSWPTLPGIKQGQDVRGLILVSPSRSFRGFTANAALQHPAVRNQISIMLIAGQDDRDSFSDSRRMFTTLEKARPKLPTDPAELRKQQDLFFVSKPSDLSGTPLLIDPRLNSMRDILYFMNTRLVANRDEYPWTDRTSPL